MIRVVIGDTVTTFVRQWGRFIATQLIVNLALALAVAVVWLLAQGLASALPDVFYAGGGPVVVAAGVVALVLLALAATPIFAAAAAVVVRAIADSLAGRHTRSWAAAILGARRTPPIVGSLLLVLLAVLGFLAATGVMILVGLLGLAASGIIHLVRRRRPEALPWWPSWRTFGTLATPLLLPARWAARAIVVIPVVVLESVGVRAGITRAGEVARSHPVRILLVGLGAIVWVNVLAVGASVLGSTIAEDLGSLVAQVLVPVLFSALPLAAATALYLRDPSAQNPPAPAATRHPRRSRARAVGLEPSTVRFVATALPVVLLLTGLVVVPAAASAAATTTQFTVTSSADDTDPGVLVTQAASCVANGPECTLRAALSAAEQVAQDGSAGTVVIGFATDMDIAVTPGATLSFDYTGPAPSPGPGGEGGDGPPPGQATSGVLAITGAGHRVSIVGDGSTALMSLFSRSWDFGVSTLELRNGAAGTSVGYGGALSIGDRRTALIDGVTFVNNIAYGGGAIYASGTVLVQNSTFTGNGLYTDNGEWISGGADVLSFGTVTVLNSTFVGSHGGSLWNTANLGNTLEVYNSLFAIDALDSGGRFNCGGTWSGAGITGADNVVAYGDTSCPGVISSSASGVAPLDYSGDTRVFRLVPFTSDGTNLALGAGGSTAACPSVDARGAVRPSSGCDAGAYQFGRDTSVRLSSAANPSMAGAAAVVTATVAATSEPGDLTGTVQFTVDGTPYGAPVVVGTGSAAIVSITGLALGDHEVTATYLPPSGSPFTGSGPTALTQVVVPSTSQVLLAATEDRVNLGDEVELTVTLDAGEVVGTGTVAVTDVTDGVPGVVIASGVALESDGTAVIRASSLAPGTRSLVASYSGDTNTTDGVSAELQVFVLRPSTTALTPSVTTVTYGSPVEFTATVSGDGPTPTGSVQFARDGHTVVAALDGGRASVVFDDLAVGEEVTATFSGSEAHQASTASSTITVLPAQTATTLATDGATVPFGVPYPLTATVTMPSGSTQNPSGQVVFRIDGQTVGRVAATASGGGTATATYTPEIAELPLGEHDLEVEFEPALTAILGSSADGDVTVQPVASTVTLVATPESAAAGQSITLAATVAPTAGAAVPDGTLTFFDGVAPLGTVSLVGGTATLATSSLSLGDHNITASYEGSGLVLDSTSASTTVVVGLAQTTTALTLPSSATYGDPISVRVDVVGALGGTPSGQVVLLEGTTEIATLPVVDGEASGTLPLLAGGAHEITARFHATSEFGSSESAATVTVSAASTTTALTTDPGTISFGEEATLTATVASTSAAPVLGTVSFQFGGTEIGAVELVASGSESVAELVTDDLPASVFYPRNELPLTAVFTPAVGGNFTSSSGTAVITVQQARTLLTLSTTSATFGSDLDVTATISVTRGAGVPNGSVLFFSGSTGTTVPVVGGVAVLSGLRLPVGSTQVTAIYTPGDVNFVAGEPDGSDRGGITVVVGAATPAVSLTSSASGSTPYGARETLSASIVTAGGPATGTVTFSAGSTVLGTVSLPDPGFVLPGAGPSTRVVTLDTTGMPLGTSSVVATYSGDGNYSTTSSGAITRTTTQGVTTTSLAASKTPTIARADVTYTATVSRTAGTGAVPVGSVVFDLDGVPAGTTTVGGDGTASITVQPSTAGSPLVTARFVPSNGGYGASQATLRHTVAGIPVDLRLSLNSTATAGDEVVVTASVQSTPLWRHLTADLPTGSVLISDGQGNSCTANLTSQNGVTREASGQCTLSWAVAGTYPLTATFAGDSVFAAALDTSRSVWVGRLMPTITLITPSDPAWVGGDAAALYWEVRGPATDGAPVTITLDGRVVCESTARAGRCDYPLPRDVTRDLRFIASFAGDARWVPTSTMLTQRSAACVYVAEPTIIPAAAGTAQATTPANCAGGTGYIDGTDVAYTATANPGYSFTRWSWSSTVNARAGQVLTNTAYFTPECVTVTVATTGWGTVNSPSTPNCGGTTWLGSGTGFRGGFIVGSVVELTAQPDQRYGPSSFYQWSGLPSGDPLAATASLTIEPGRPLSLRAVFGTTCYHDVQAVQPVGGTVTLGTPNCTDAAGPGYAAQSRVPVRSTAVDESAFFQGWTGNFWVPDNAVSTDRESTASLYIYRDNLRVSATYGTCVQLNVGVEGWSPSGVPLGYAVLEPAGTCPTKGDGWYAIGSTVRLVAKTAYSSTFAGWGGPPVMGQATNPTNAAVVTAGGTFVAKFYWQTSCAKLDLMSEPAGAFDVKVDIPWGIGTCPAGTFDKTLGSSSGVPVTVTVTPLTDLAKNSVVGTTVTTGTLVQGTSTTLPPLRGQVTSRTIYGNTTITAWACTTLNATLTLISPNGTPHPNSNLAAEDFISAAPAPNCPFGSMNYLPGSTTYVQANAPTDGYKFEGWSGVLTTTDPYPLETISFDGTKAVLPLTATYRVICHTLTTNWDNVKVTPAPNCPDTPASANSYIGGTLVSLQATGDGSLLFRGWHGDAADASEDIFAFTMMTGDRAIYANYTSPSVGERITSAFTSVGDSLAVFSKKVVGVASAIVAGLVTGANPVIGALGAVALLGKGIDALFSALGVEGAVLDGITGAMEDIGEFVNFYMSPFSCATQWALAGDQGNSDTPNYAAAQQSAVSALAARALQEQSIRDSAAIAAQSGQAPVAAGALTWAKRLGTAATVGFAVYNAATSASGIGWDSAGAAAWTDDSVFFDCYANSSPDYMFPRPVNR